MLHNCLLFLSLAISVYVKKIILRNEHLSLFIKIQCKYIYDATQHGQKRLETNKTWLKYSILKWISN